jgi:hypothetical protein
MLDSPLKLRSRSQPATFYAGSRLLALGPVAAVRHYLAARLGVDGIERPADFT